MENDSLELSFQERSILLKGARFLVRIFQPTSQDEDLRNREYVFNIISFSSLLTSGLFTFVVIYRIYTMGDSYKGLPFSIILIIFVVFHVLFILSKKGRFILASYLLVSLYFAANTYMILFWGVDVPMGLLAYALIIVMTGILLGSKASFIATFIIFATMGIVADMQTHSIIVPASYWKTEPATVVNTTEFAFVLGIISIISWLSNRQIQKSLNRARRSETELKQEKDNLEIKVKERTEALHKAQFEKMRQLYRFAEFGRLSSGLFHDLNNYLMALSLSLERAKAHQTDASLGKVKSYLNQAVETSAKMEDFIEAIQKQLKKQEEKTRFSVAKEINQVLKLFHFRTTKEQIEVFSKCQKNYFLFGNPIRFNQAITNIMSNAFDSYLKLPPDCKSRKIEIGVWQEKKATVIVIRDWGCGISQENLQKIFEPFFTTKGATVGIGIGLTSTKEIIEKDFHGTLQVDSQENYGSSFKITIPYANEKSA